MRKFLEYSEILRILTEYIVGELLIGKIIFAHDFVVLVRSNYTLMTSRRRYNSNISNALIALLSVYHDEHHGVP